MSKAQRKWRDANPERARELHLLSRFGLTAAEYAVLIERQGGVCAICGKAESCVDPRTEKPRALAVDHCHETGVVRGLLCFSCNVGIGFLGDNWKVAAAAADYLRRRS